MRAREPDQQGHVEVGRRPARLRDLQRRGRDDRSSSSRSTPACTAARGRARSRTSPSTTAWSRSTRRATAGPDARSTRRRTTTCRSSPTRSRSSTTSASRRPCWPGICVERLAGAAHRGPASRPGPGRGGGGAVGAGLHPADRHPAGGRAALRRGARRLQRLVRLEPPLHAGPLAGVRRRSSSTNMLPEPHSTKQLEDIHAYNCDTSGHVMLAENESRRHPGTPEEAEALLRGIVRPVLVIQGTDDRCQPLGRGESVVRWTGGEHLVLEGAGHLPMARHPVLVNRAIKSFVDRVTGAAVTARRRRSVGTRRPPRALYLSSPIGLGPRAPRPRDRRRDARAATRPGDPVADPVAGGGVPRAPRRGRAPGLAAAGQRVGALRVGVGRARPARLPGRAADGRGAGQQLHGLRRPGRAGDASTCGWATRPGTSTTSCTSTPS